MATLLTPCTVVKQNGYNLFGEEIAGIRKREKCAVIEVTQNVMHTSLRTDKTASVGSAEELLGDATLLLAVKTIADIGDTILIPNDGKYKVISKRSRYNASGQVDHYEVRCGIGR